MVFKLWHLLCNDIHQRHRFSPSKSEQLIQKAQPRRKLHPRSRIKNLANVDLQENQQDIDALLLESERLFYENVEKITDERDGQYLALMKDGSRSWVDLSEDHELVIQYLARIPPPAAQVGMQKIKDVNEWNLCPFIPDDEIMDNDH